MVPAGCDVDLFFLKLTNSDTFRLILLYDPVRSESILVLGPYFKVLSPSFIVSF